MFKSRTIYRFVVILLIFAALIIVPYSFIVLTQVQKMFEEEGQREPARVEEYSRLDKEISARLIEQALPLFGYILILAFLLSAFSLRKVRDSLSNLREGSLSFKDGDSVVSLTDDEVGDITGPCNETAASLKTKAGEFDQKDMYLNVMLDPLWVVDDDNRITDINPAFTRLFGYSREKAVGASVFDFLDADNAAIMKRQFQEKRDKGVSSIYELSVTAKSGTQIPVLVSGSPIYSGDRMIAKIGILKDFREQISLRTELQQSLNYIETIMDSISDELLVIDRNYKIVMANRIAARQADQDLIGRSCHEALHGSPVPCWHQIADCPTRKVIMTGRSHRTVHEHRDGDGVRRYYEILASPIKDADGNVMHVIELLRDVTERIQYETEILRKNLELTALNSISGIVSRSLKPDEIFMKVLDKMTEMLSMDGGGFFFLDESSREMTCQYHKGISDEYVNLIGRVRLGDDIPGRVALTGQIMSTSDLSRDPGIDRSIMKRSGMKGYCCIPVKGKEKTIGVFCLFSFSPRLFTPEEESVLCAIGEMTGLALENIRLYEKMRSLFEQQRRRWEEEHHQLLDLSAKLGAAVDIKEIMPQVLGLMKKILRADFVWLLESDLPGNLQLMFSSKRTGREGDIVYPAEVSSLERLALTKRQPVVLPSVRSQSKFYLSPEVSSYHSAVAVPMFIGEKPVGVYTLYHAVKREIKEEDIHFFEIIGNMLSIALERSEYYTRADREKELADTVLQSVTDGIITIDMSGRIISVNSAFEKMSGIDQKTAIGSQVCDNFRFTEENISFRILLGESVEEAREGASVSHSSVMATRYGNKLPVIINSSPIIDRSGAVTGVVNVIRDMSRQKELDRMKTELVRSVSHEFRTPLSAIVGMTEMLLHGDVEGDKANQYLTIMRNEGLRLSNMVSELLSIARIESGKETLQYVSIDLREFLSSILESVGPRLKSKGATVSCEILNAGQLMGDEEKIGQVLIHLIDNALTFSDDGCMIRIGMQRNGEMLDITITDRGWGIPEEDMPHIAERFYRGRHGTRVKGTGLGLALSQEILKMHGGSMTIKSTLGQGTSVTVSIPYREGD